jgi:hypothetical protein
VSEHSPEVYLERISKEMKHIREMMVDVVNFMRESESEVPDKIHRFVLYMHDIREISRMYQELGHSAPDYVVRELERCDDRLRHLLEDLHTDGGTFEKIRRDMAGREGNRWDHSRAVCGPRNGA